MAQTLTHPLHAPKVNVLELGHKVKNLAKAVRNFAFKLFFRQKEKTLPIDINSLKEHRNKIEVLINLDPQEVGGKSAYLFLAKELTNKDTRNLELAKIFLRARKEALDDFIAVTERKNDLTFVRKVFET